MFEISYILLEPSSNFQIVTWAYSLCLGYFYIMEQRKVQMEIYIKRVDLVSDLIFALAIEMLVI